jgi:uncharacterized protein (DUF2461 family)
MGSTAHAVSPLCVKCAKAHGKCYRCGDLPKPARTYLHAVRKYFDDELHRYEAMSTTLETLLANEDRADFKTRGVDAVAETSATFAWQYLGYQQKNKIQRRLDAFVKLFDVDDDAAMIPQLPMRLQGQLV